MHTVCAMKSMMTKKIKIALVQMRVSMDKGENLRKCELFLAEAKSGQAEIAILPELFTMPFDPEPLLAAAEPFEGGETVGRIRQAAQQNGLTIIAGSFAEAAPEAGGQARVYNTSFAVGGSGELLAKYRKIHLFDPAYGGVAIRESDCMLPGNEPAFFDCAGIPAALAICYDLRFPAFWGRLARGGAKMVFVPAAFNQVSGPAHWEVLARARALDGQFFVFACSPAPNPDLRYKPYGHSLALDPWGTVLLDAGEGEGVFFCDIDPARADEVREQLPLARQARPDVYG